jgi:hypothetical protein
MIFVFLASLVLEMGNWRRGKDNSGIAYRMCMYAHAAERL